MELMYPFVLIVGILFLIILIFVNLKKKSTYENGKKVANTQFVKEMPYYQEVMKKYKKLTSTIKILCIISMVMSLLLLARPCTIDASENPQYSRDIILCMDVSDSVNELNEELVNNLKKVVGSLKGERFGISIFNTSSVLLVPLTDDYDYIIETLDNLQKNFAARNSFLKKGTISGNDNVYYATEYIQAGTLVGNEIRGSSIIGDGLATAITNFGDLSEERTRIIIFSTDNELYGKELITLEEAGKMCKDREITVFGIAPSTILGNNKIIMKNAVEETGGIYYTEGDNNVSDIVKNIEQKGKSLIKGKKETKMVNKPELPFVMILISTTGLFVLNKKVNL